MPRAVVSKGGANAVKLRCVRYVHGPERERERRGVSAAANVAGGMAGGMG